MKKYIVLGSVVALLAGPAIAADWSFDPRIDLNAVYNDNNRLTDIPGQEIKVSGAKLDAQLAMRAETPTTSFGLVPRLRSTFYPSESQEETDDQFLRIFFKQKSERSKISLDADYSRVETLGYYFPAAVINSDDQLGNPDSGVDIGRTVGRNRQERLVVTPAIWFDVTPRQTLELRAEYLDVAYDRQVQADSQDYTNLVGSAAYSFKLSQTAAMAIRASVGQYEPKQGASTDGYGLRAEWSNRISDISQVYVNAGVNRVQTALGPGGGNTGWETGFAGGAGIMWAFEVTQVFADLNRYLDPNSSGKVITRDQLRVEFRRQFSEKTTAYIAARGIKDQGAADGSSFRPRDYATANVGFEWRVRRQWSIVGSYNYAWREYRDALNAAESNAFNLGVVYEPHRR